MQATRPDPFLGAAYNLQSISTTLRKRGLIHKTKVAFQSRNHRNSGQCPPPVLPLGKDIGLRKRRNTE